MKWCWPWHNGDTETRRIRDEAERRLAAAKKMTPRVQRLANDMELSTVEFADRMARAFRARPS